METKGGFDWDVNSAFLHITKRALKGFGILAFLLLHMDGLGHGWALIRQTRTSCHRHVAMRYWPRLAFYIHEACEIHLNMSSIFAIASFLHLNFSACLRT